MALNHQRLVESYRRSTAAEVSASVARVREAFVADKGIRDSFDLGALFEACFGFEEYRACRRNRQARPVHAVFEAAGAVNTAMFSNITGQWAYATFLDIYDGPDLVFKNAIPSRPSPFKSERVPGVSAIGDEALVVEEGKEYPLAAPSENWTDTPDTRKRGFIVPVTWEAIFFDRTQGQLKKQVTDNATWMGVNREKRAIDCVIDAGETTQSQYRYRWLNLGPIATYGNISGNHNWDNLSGSTPLTDYKSIQTVWTLMQGLTDPFTGEPLNAAIKDLVVPPSLAWAVPVAFGGNVSQVTPGYATSANPVKTEYPNPAGTMIGQPRVLSSQLLQARMTAASHADNTWYYGDLARAFVYIENLPTEVTTAPAGSEAEFTRDVVLRTKVREMGTYSTVEPRHMGKATP